MNAQELKTAYAGLYSQMANSGNPDYMYLFGRVMTEMFNWYADNKPEAAMEWLEKLSAIRWKNYVTPKEAEAIVSEMDPKAPWSLDQWRSAMQQNGYPLDDEPYYNRCALYVTMNMLMSDSSVTISKYVNNDQVFKLVHDLAVDKLKDQDGKFIIREYFDL